MLREERLDLCVTSRFPRAGETAGLVLGARDVPRLEMADLDDLHFGKFEGRPLEEYRTWARDNAMTTRIPGGESRAELAMRYCKVMRQLRERPEGTILVVAHGLPLTYVVRAAERQQPQPVMQYLGYAVPYVLPSDALTRAVECLEDWLGEPATS
jgi:broad specificity phosphatase PhoE